MSAFDLSVPGAHVNSATLRCLGGWPEGCMYITVQTMDMLWPCRWIYVHKGPRFSRVGSRLILDHSAWPAERTMLVDH